VVSVNANSLRLDKPTRVGVNGKSQRCLPGCSTAAANANFIDRADDATSAAKQYAKLAEVKKLDADLGLHLSFSGRFVLGQK
jgi:hypothetical protein